MSSLLELDTSWLRMNISASVVWIKAVGAPHAFGAPTAFIHTTTWIAIKLLHNFKVNLEYIHLTKRGGI